MRLAHQYYDSETIQQLAGDADAINMLRSPPDWALASTIKSDYVLKKRSRGASMVAVANEEKEEKSKEEAIVQEVKYPYAVIAAGLGPDGDGDARKRRRRRKMLRTGAIVVGVVAIIFGMVDRDMLLFRSNSTTVTAKTIVAVVHRSEKGLQKDGSVSVEQSSNLSLVSDHSINFMDDGISHDDEEEVPEPSSINPKDDSEDDASVPKVVEVEPKRDPPSDVDTPAAPRQDATVEKEMAMDIGEKSGSVQSENEQPNPIQLVTAFLNQNAKPANFGQTISREAKAVPRTTKGVLAEKVEPVQFGQAVFREAKVVVRTTKDALAENVNPVQFGQAVFREAKAIARTTKDALAENVELVKFGQAVFREAKVIAGTAKDALAGGAEIVFL